MLLQCEACQGHLEQGAAFGSLMHDSALCTRCVQEMSPHEPRFFCQNHGCTTQVCFKCVCKGASSRWQKAVIFACSLKNPSGTASDSDDTSDILSEHEHARSEFSTQLILFRFCDTNRSGQLNLDQFTIAVNELKRLCAGVGSMTQEWELALGSKLGHVNFRNFCAWTTSHGLEIPVGVDTRSNSDEPCRFREDDGFTMCQCSRFVPGDQDTICQDCSHRKSCHRSDAADLSYADWLHRPVPADWTEGASGLLMVRDNETLERLQNLMTGTHKETDNWDRDRGCAIHGVHNCRIPCLKKNQQKVPTGYQLLWAMRNQDQDMWNSYMLMKESMRPETVDAELELFPMATSPFVPIGTEPLDVDFNEWYLFHGAPHAACTSICSTGFDISKAGTGQSWKPATGIEKGSPLYGYGAYFAERITKADSYSHALPGQTGDEPEDHFCVLLCRCIGGKVQVEYRNEIDKEALRQCVFQGSNHSVLGDRVRDLGKPFREVVMYDKAQIYPEYILYYKRLYDGIAPVPPAEYAFSHQTDKSFPTRRQEKMAGSWAGHCPWGHHLTKLDTLKVGSLCYMCNEPISPDTHAYGCVPCNFQLCDSTGCVKNFLARRSLPVGLGPAGHAFEQGQLVDFHSDSIDCWFFTRILSTKPNGAIEVAVKPGSWIPKEEQVPSRVRPHVPPSPDDVGGLGQHVEYCGSSGAWLAGIVVQVCKDRSVRLDIRNKLQIPEADFPHMLRVRQHSPLGTALFAEGDLVEYVSKNYGKLEAFITAVDPSGAVQINCKPGHWISLDIQQERMSARSARRSSVIPETL